MALAFPSSPSVGDEFAGGGFTWTWNGGAWAKLASSSGGASGEDFLLDVGVSGNTTFTFDSDMAAGQYAISSQLSDTSLEIYLVASDDTSAGYTTTSSVTASKAFNRIVVYGATSGDSIAFVYQKAVSPTASGNVGGGVPPFIISSDTATLPNEGSTTVITGGNFASDVEADFIDKNGTAYPATVTRTSSSSLIIARPDDMLASNGPYSIKVRNPGFNDSALKAHTLSNVANTGTGPSWDTDATLPIYALNSSYSTTLSATDPDGAPATYSVVSGSLPPGLSLDSVSGTISGTATADAASTQVTIRATDAGGNFVDREFKLSKLPTVTGGTAYTDTTYVYRKFTGTSTLYVGGSDITYDAFLLGGGGGGGGVGGPTPAYHSWMRAGGGGGGGGVLQVNSRNLSVGTHTVTVGGSETKIGADSTDIAYGGGGGGFSGANGGDGASGGGGGVRYHTYESPQQANGAGGLAIYGAQGNNGGASAGSTRSGSGGGLNTTAYYTAWLQKVGGPSTVAAGGGYANSSDRNAGSTGAGGANSGAGGGGSWQNGNSSAGGGGAQAGIAIIRYPRTLTGE